jgi:Fic family protein
MSLFDALGFHWDRLAVPAAVPTHSVDRACFRFHRMLPEFVWDASVLEGNPFTFPEVKTLLDGVTVGGRKISDQEQILNLAESSKHLLTLVKAGRFALDKATFTDLHRIVARNEALEWGVFRGEGEETNYTPPVALGEHGQYLPPPTVAGGLDLHRTFIQGAAALKQEVLQPFEKGTAFFLFGALQQFFFDGNKRTSRFMMNGILMSAGIDAISVPAVKAQEFNEKMVRFYLTKDGTEMMAFLVDCHPEAPQIKQAKDDTPSPC